MIAKPKCLHIYHNEYIHFFEKNANNAFHTDKWNLTVLYCQIETFLRFPDLYLKEDYLHPTHGLNRTDRYIWTVILHDLMCNDLMNVNDQSNNTLYTAEYFVNSKKT